MSEGSLIVVLEASGGRRERAAGRTRGCAGPAQAPAPAASGEYRASHASPSVRKFARELGVDVSRVTGTGPKSRITKDDVTAFVKGVMTGQRAAPGAAAAPRAAAS
ncbi:hypothetical protein BMMON3_20600 [Burkholderia mallei]